jgi:cyclopropane-fatty-acyl-phospholipid synthase
MVFGRNMIDIEQVSVDAPRDSDAWYLGLLGCQFPGSLLPFGQEQIERCAEPNFRLVQSTSGRLDYIETINQWNARIGAPGLGKKLAKLRLLPLWLRSREFRLGFTSGVAANQVCFERELLDHYRLVFERT